MGHWGWRPLILSMFISVWIIGCTVAHETAPPITPTEYPLITLTVRFSKATTPTDVALALPSTPTLSPLPTLESNPSPVVYVVQPGDTLLGIAQLFGIDLSALQAANTTVDPLALPIGQTLVIPNPANTRDGFPIRPTPTPLALAVQSPACYELRSSSIICLGLVDNVLDQVVERVRVGVELFGPDGMPLASRAADLDQRIIPPGQSAPYRVQFGADDGIDAPDQVVATATVLRADLAADVEARFVALDMLDEGGSMDDGSYVVSMTLANPTEHAAEAIRLVVTLRDSEGGLAGYRAVQTDWPLAAGERRPIAIAVIPRAPVAAYSVYVEAVRAAG